MIKAKSITVTRAEGPTQDCGRPLTFDAQNSANVWESAEATLRVWARTAPGQGGGYDKVDFKIVYEDGEVYEGRYDLTNHEPVDLACHIRRFVTFYSGTLTAEDLVAQYPHIKPNHYLAILNRQPGEAQKFRDWLATYEIGRDEPSVPTPEERREILKDVPSSDEVRKRIRKALRQRSGKDWTVKRGRGTAYGWITITAPPKRSVCGLCAWGEAKPEECGCVGEGWHMSQADAAELAQLLGLEKPVHYQGENVPASSDYYREYLDRAEGRKPAIYGTQYWD